MNIFKIEIKNSLKGLILWIIVMALMLILFMSVFPSMSNEAMKDLVNAKLSSLPQGMLKAFNLENMPNLTELTPYFAYCAQYINMAGCIYAAILGSSSLIKEESEGTIEFLYAKPVSRSKIVTSKLFANITLILIFNTILLLVSLITCKIAAPKNYNFTTPVTKIFIYSFIINLVFFSIGFGISTMLSSSRQSTPTALGVFFITYILGIFSGVIDKLNFLKYFSPFNYALPNNVIKAGYSMETPYVILTIALLTLGILFTYFTYIRKDMKL